ncbi:MAG: hypothetical protein UT21_C0006G0002 [Candidatus Woesebacteria bacterium GW2011_GWA1_39_11b]|nr:MAG: hypothetical protein UT21_C0006G0002 [Candidatus Woesebacteria bacterium GW2011_GWA1_39_11b]
MKETDTNTDAATFENGTAPFGNMLLCLVFLTFSVEIINL